MKEKEVMSPKMRKAFDEAHARLRDWQQATPRASATIWWQDNQIIARCAVGDGPAFTMQFLPEVWQWAIEVLTSTVSEAPQVERPA